MAVVEYRTPWKRLRKGLCTTWLAGLGPAAAGLGEPKPSLAPGAVVPVWVKGSELRLPEDAGRDASVPIVLVGPGTGIAPMRSLLWERRSRAAGAGNSGGGGALLFVGCRGEGDFLYRDEWAELARAGVIGGGGAVVAMSRAQGRKVYVQHKIRERGAEVWAAVEAGATVYVSGSANKMPSDVREAFVDVAARWGAMSAADAEDFVRKLELRARFLVECWS